MEINTGAAVTIVPRSICSVKLEPPTRKLRSATGQLMTFAGQTTVKALIGKSTKLLTLYVVKQKCPLLFGSIFWRKLDEQVNKPSSILS